MRTGESRKRLAAQTLQHFTGVRGRSIFDSRNIDELVHAINLLLQARIELTNEPVGRIALSDLRARILVPASPGEGLKLSTWHVKEHHDEYVACVSWNGTKEGTKLEKIAKPGTLRTSIAIEQLPDGTILTYSLWDLINQTRQADGDDGTSEVQAITPRYMIVPDDLSFNAEHVIYATTGKTFTEDEDGKPIRLMDMNIQGRAYAKVS